MLEEDSIRRGESSDWHEIVKISLEAFGASSWPWERWRPLLAAAGTGATSWALVAEPPGELGPAAAPRPLAGFLVMQVVPGELEIQALAVARAWRGQGWGTRLLAAACERGRASGCETALLEVRAGNLAAQEFYRRRGFAIYARRPEYYRSPIEDGLLMRKELK